MNITRTFALALAGAALASLALGQQENPKHAGVPAAAGQPAAETPAKQPEKPEAPYKQPDEPGLKVGEKVDGEVKLQDREGNEVTLASLYEKQPVIITFYRGGWCPFCNRALQQWQERLEDVQIAGADFIAVTMEKPEYIEETIEKQGLDYRVFADPQAKASEAFKLKFALADTVVKKYKGYGIDLERNNGNGKWELPAPGTFLIDTDGVVRYAFADWDYKKRADPDDVLDVLRQLEAEEAAEPASGE